jgi:hypothetical protein
MSPVRSARLPGREEWRRIEAQGLHRFLLGGAIRRAIPMTILALFVIELFNPGGFTRERLTSGEFLGRVAFVLTVFLIGGVATTYARWKTCQSLYGGGST